MYEYVANQQTFLSEATPINLTEQLLHVPYFKSTNLWSTSEPFWVKPRPQISQNNFYMYLIINVWICLQQESFWVMPRPQSSQNIS